MTKLEKRRDEMRPRDLHFRPECEGFRCGAHNSWTDGFNAMLDEHKRVVEPLFEALELCHRRMKYTAWEDEECFEMAEKAIEQYKSVVGE